MVKGRKWIMRGGGEKREERERKREQRLADNEYFEMEKHFSDEKERLNERKSKMLDEKWSILVVRCALISWFAGGRPFRLSQPFYVSLRFYRPPCYGGLSLESRVSIEKLAQIGSNCSLLLLSLEIHLQPVTNFRAEAGLGFSVEWFSSIVSFRRFRLECFVSKIGFPTVRWALHQRTHWALRVNHRELSNSRSTESFWESLSRTVQHSLLFRS